MNAEDLRIQSCMLAREITACMEQILLDAAKGCSCRELFAEYRRLVLQQAECDQLWLKQVTRP